MSRRFLLFAILACVSLFYSQAPAQMYEGHRLVRASLVADTDAIVPGKPFTVGLLLKIAPGWHTYWLYAGDAGFATKIEWDLPPGFKAGPIQWPVPEKDSEGGLDSYVYNDEVLLLVEITPPAKIDAKQIGLGGKASWLVCEKVCVPGDAEVSVALPVAEQATPANADLFAKYRALLPATGDKDFKYAWKTGQDAADLDFKIPGAGSKKIDFYPLPGPGMTLDHPVVTSNDAGTHATIKITSGEPGQLAGVAVLGEGGDRKGWLVPPEKSVPPSASDGSQPGASSSVAPGSSGPAAPGLLLRYLLLGFFGGMLLNVMPCVLPVITLKIYSFINQAGQSRGRVFELGLAYCAGIFAWFLGLAALIVKFGVNWSFQFQNKGFVFAMMAVCLVFGLSLVGLFELMLPTNLNTGLAALSSKEGIGGAFVHGLFTTLLGSACTAPLLGPAIGFALSQPPSIIFSLYATIAAGMALPYFLLTANPAWMRFLPKPGMWMVRVKQVMGVLVIATAVWFGYVFFRQVTAEPVAFKPRLESALKSGKIVFIDFTADWCINCKYNEKVVLKSGPVQEAFKKDDVVILTADWTNGDPEITSLLKQIGRAGVPAYVLYPAGSPDRPIVLSEQFTQQTVLDGLKEAKTQSTN